MTELKRTLSVQFHYDLDQTKRWLKFYFDRLLPPTLLLLLTFCLFSAFILILGRFRVVTVPDTVPPDLVFSFCTAVVAFVGGQILSGLTDMVVVFFVFVPLAITGWFVVRMALNLAYPLFFPVAHQTTRRSKQFDRFFTRRLRRVSLLLDPAFIAAVAIGILVAIHEHGMSTSLIVRSLGIAFCLAVPYAFAFHWSFFLRVLKRKDHAGRNLTHFKAYLFSEGSIRSSFLTSVKFMIFIALLAWILLPIPMRASAGVAKSAEAYFSVLIPGYETIRTEAEQKLILHPGYEWKKLLPMPVNIRNAFDIFSEPREAICPEHGSPVFLGYLFLLVALASLMQVALPVCARAIRERGYAAAVRKLLLASVKTTTVIVLLKLFVAKAFLVDFGSIMGVGTAFTYGLAAFLAFQNRDKERTERTREPTVP